MCKQACLKTGEHSPCDHVSIYFPPNALKTIHLVCAFTGTELVSEFGEPMRSARTAGYGEYVPKNLGPIKKRSKKSSN